MRVLVTGSEGYIGTLLAPKLKHRGHQVHRLDAGLFRACAFWPVSGPRAVVWKDIRDVERRDLAGFDALIHLAALSNDPLSDMDPRLTNEINCEAAVGLADMAKAAGVRRFVFSSTCSVYGAQGDTVITETSRTNPLTVYAKSKLQAENDIGQMASKGFDVIHLRHGTAYGASPLARFDLVVNNLIAWANTTGRVRLKSDGSAWRPLVHVEDICLAFSAALELELGDVPLRIFNIGKSTDNMQIADLADMIARQMNCSVEFAEDAGKDNRSYRVNCGLAENELVGFAPQWSLERGIQQVIDMVRACNIDVRDIEGHRYRRVSHLKHLLETGRVGQDLRFPVAA